LRGVQPLVGQVRAGESEKRATQHRGIVAFDRLART
jgi:hypothetical protein